MTYNQYTKNEQELQRDSHVAIGNLVAKRVDLFKYDDVRFDSDDSLPDYIGLAAGNLATSDDSWIVFKFTYSGNNATRIQKAVGSWNNRSSLF